MDRPTDGQIKNQNRNRYQKWNFHAVNHFLFLFQFQRGSIIIIAVIGATEEELDNVDILALVNTIQSRVSVHLILKI